MTPEELIARLQPMRGTVLMPEGVAGDNRVMVSEIIDALASLTRQVEEASWRSMETAPRDRRILGWCEFPAGQEARIVQWCPWVGDDGAFMAYNYPQTVTRWMEVPAFARPTDISRAPSSELLRDDLKQGVAEPAADAEE